MRRNNNPVNQGLVSWRKPRGTRTNDRRARLNVPPDARAHRGRRAAALTSRQAEPLGTVEYGHRPVRHSRHLQRRGGRVI